MIRLKSSKEYGVIEGYNAQTRAIGDLLGESLKGQVVVPKFQRGYSWGKKHVGDFWKDVWEFRKQRDNKNSRDAHFLGPIVVLQTDAEKDTTYILDGQQRLATATILFSVLRDLANGLNTQESMSFADDVQNHQITKEDYGLCLKMGLLDHSYFEATIQQCPPQSLKPKIKSHNNIKAARDLLMTSVKTILPSDPVLALKDLKELRTTIRRDLIMASIPVRSERDAFKIFETLNDRGLRLSVPDLLLNFLMGTAHDDDERLLIRKCWDGIIEAMAKRDVGVFIRHIWVSKYGDLKKVDLFTALKDHIESSQVDSLTFAQTCSTECDRYVELLRASKDDLEVAARSVHALVNEISFEQTLPLLLSAHTLLDNKKELDKLARLILVFVTRYSMLMGLDISGLETTMFELAREIRKLPANKVVSHVKKILALKAPNDDQLLAINVEGDQLKLRQQDAVYILSRLAFKMQTKTKELTLGESNLEHVFPKNPDSEWGDTSALEDYLWHLGNLTMLGKKMNNKIGNSYYSTKRKYYLSNTELVMTQNLANHYQHWDVVTIQDRAKHLLPLVIELWNFNNTSYV